MKKMMLMCAIMLGLTTFAVAQDHMPRVDARQHVQRARIYDGRQNDELTRRETRRLHHEQRHIRRAERRAKIDGEVTRKERAKLTRKQNRASRHIRRAKHNEFDRG